MHVSLRDSILFTVLGLLLPTFGAPSVQIAAGTINGKQCDLSDVQSFLGVPYAKPPVGSLRFSSPQPYDKTFPATGLDATQAAVSCQQFGSSFVENGTQSEDCLLLDVYVPGNATRSSSLPVKVWVHGGSNEAGGISDPTYTGCLAADESIFVSINYRLGPLGYLAFKNAGLAGNYGLQDQLLGLQWVQDNIAAFGGDPKRVLLFGQSAGAVDVFALATLPQITSLVTSAALESGGGRDLPTLANVQAYNTQFAKLVNCSDIECLRTVSIDSMEQAVITLSDNFIGVNTLLENSGFGDVWGPIIDGDLLTTQPSQRGVQVPSIFGFNADDGTLFVLGAYQAKIVNLTETDYAEFLQANFDQLADTIQKQFPTSLFNTEPLPVYSAMVAVLTDYAYRCPAYRALNTAAKNGIDAWAYNFNVTPSCPWYGSIPSNPEILRLLGSTHTAELPFVFGEVANLPLPSGNCSFTSSEKAISAFMEGAWTSLSANGNPSPDWPQWDGKKGINIQNTIIAGEIDFRACDFWDQIDATILQSVSTNTSQQINGTSPSTTPPIPTASSEAVSIRCSTSDLLMVLPLIGGMILADL